MIHLREPRRRVRLIAQFRCGGDWRAIAITNVTSAGLRCECPDPPEINTPVEIRYQGFSIIGAVQWCTGDEFGVVCNDTVDVEMLVDGSPEVDVGRRALPRLEVRFPAEFLARDRSFPVVVLDVSPGGARLSMEAPPPRGARGVIKWDGMECGCTVVWSGKSSFGVIFGDELPAEPPPLAERAPTGPAPSGAARQDGQAQDAAPLTQKREDRRRAARVAVDWTCDVHHADARRARVQMSNISTDGCMIGWFAGCRQDVPLYIKLPNLTTVQANVMWKKDRRIGCRFSQPLNTFVLEYLLAEGAA